MFVHAGTITTTEVAVSYGFIWNVDLQEAVHVHYVHHVLVI